MRKIEILDNVRLRFPGRDDEFDLGLEVGSISVLMAQGVPLIQRQMSPAASDQLRPIAERFRYALVATPAQNGLVDVSLLLWSQKPMLRIVSSTLA